MYTRTVMEQKAKVIRTSEGSSNLPRETARRFGFTPDLDVLVLKVIQFSGADVANHRKKTKLFEHTIATFVNQESAKEKITSTSCHPTWKTLRDRI